MKYGSSREVDNWPPMSSYKYMRSVKAHIVFKKGKAEKPETRSKMLAKVKKTSQISEVNEKRFDLYGILTGKIDEDKLDKVRQIPEVDSVEIDEEKELQ